MGLFVGKWAFPIKIYSQANEQSLFFTQDDCSQATQICVVHTDEMDQSIPESIFLQFSVATKAELIKLISKQQWRQSNKVVRLTKEAWVKCGMAIQQPNQ